MKTSTRTESPARQVAGLDADLHPILSVLTKRTYRIEADGRCVPAEEQLPLVLDAVSDADCPDLLAQDTDLYPLKLATDVVVKGHAHAGRARASLDVAVHVGKACKLVRVLGDRRCTRSATGRIVFSEPTPFEHMPLRYTLAYGGRDTAAEARHGNPCQELAPFLDAALDVGKCSPYIYPRNPCGTGYLVEATEEGLAGLKLPNLEDPLDLLSPERLVAGAIDRWPVLPIPQAFDWLDYGAFPRIAYLGVVPDHAPLAAPVAEVARGLAPRDIMFAKPLMEGFNLRFASGASLGLQLPYLHPREEFQLVHLHPGMARFRFRLPGDRPRIWTDGREGKLHKTEPVIHTVVVEPEESRVSVLWRGSARALRPYLPDELEEMPFRVQW